MSPDHRHTLIVREDNCCGAMAGFVFSELSRLQEKSLRQKAKGLVIYPFKFSCLKPSIQQDWQSCLLRVQSQLIYLQPVFSQGIETTVLDEL